MQQPCIRVSFLYIFNVEVAHSVSHNLTTLIDVPFIQFDPYKKITSGFYGSDFNEPVDSWDTSSVTSMMTTFQLATVFNQPMNSWDVSSVNTMFMSKHISTNSLVHAD